MAEQESFRALVIAQQEGKVVANVETLRADALPAGDVLVQVQFSDLNYKDGLVLKGLGKLVRT